MKKINKIFIPLATVALLASCGNNVNTNNVNQTPAEDAIEGTQLNLKESSKDSYAYNALTSIRLLNLSDASDDPIEGEGEGTPVDPTEPGEGEPTPDDPSQDETPSEDEVDPNLETINNYLNMYDNLINGDGVLVSETLVSDKEDYTNMLVIKAKEVSGEQVTYTLYYNIVNLDEDVTGDEVLPEEETPVDPEEPTPDDPITPETSEDSTSVPEGELVPSERYGGHGHKNKERTLIEGLLITGDLEVEVRGFNEIDEDETETILKARLEDGTSIRIKQVSETDESSFSYTIRKNHRTVVKNKVSIEKDENETELKVSYYNQEEGTYEKYTFKEEIEENTRYMKIRYNVNGEKGTIRIFFETDEEGNVEMTYYLSNGHSYHHDHDGWHHGHGHGHGHDHDDYAWDDEDYDWSEFDESYWEDYSEEDYFNWDEFFSEYFDGEEPWNDDSEDEDYDYEDDYEDDDEDDDYWDDYYDNYHGGNHGHGHGHGHH